VSVAIIVTTINATCNSFRPVLFESLRALPAVSDDSFLKVESVSIDRKLKTFAGGSTFAVHSGDQVIVRGRAFDPFSKRPAAGVFAVVDDGRAFRATYGGDRTNEGFFVLIATGALAPGSHRLHLRVVSSGLSGYYEPQDVAFVVY